ncbi:hypothetical protein [Actinoplanes sp. M2I2]|uniref:hypothetical protein n=1 Tax=Actinoplanes sp. M2I2 TaxID=1734444 RepID=UPI00202159A3|nr:hypothetical protein [Actinoplanes sp. M2I2]
MTEDLRALLRAELNNERPPPLGDVVGAALRDGRRVRRRRRAGFMAGGSATVLALVLAGGVAAYSEPRHSAGVGSAPAAPVVAPSPAATAWPNAPGQAAQKATVSPGSVPVGPTALLTGRPGRTLAIHSGVDQAAGTREKATTGAMLHLLTQLLPAGRTSNAAVSGAGDPHVQIRLDRGTGPGLLRVTVGLLPVEGARPPRGGTATVTILHVADNCLQDTVAIARWPDGTAVQVDVASCLTGSSRGPRALTADEAATVAADARWGVTMDPDLIKAGAREFGRVPVLVS